MDGPDLSQMASPGTPALLLQEPVMLLKEGSASTVASWMVLELMLLLHFVDGHQTRAPGKSPPG